VFPNIFIHRTLLAALALTIPYMSAAAEITSLKDSVSFAIQNNRLLSAAAGQVSAAQAQTDLATAQLLPSLDISTGFIRTNSPLNSFGTKLQQQRITQADFDANKLNNPSYINNYQSRLGLNMPLFSGGAIWAARKSAQYHAKASELNFEFRKQQLIYQTIAAYVLSRQSLAQMDAQKHAVNAANKRWLDAKALKKRGLSIESDVMDAYVHLLRSKVRLDETKNMYANSLESLRWILGMNADTTLDTQAEPNIHFSPSSLTDLLDQASIRRTDFLALQSELSAADSAQDQAKSGYYPHVNLMAAQEWNNPTFGLKNSNAMVGVQVTMNIFSGAADLAKSRAAEAQRVTLSLQLEDKHQFISNEIKQAWRSVHTAKKRLQSEVEALKQTEESLRIKALRHHQGLEKTSDLLDAQVRADASKVAQIRAKYDYMIAKAALLLASGTLNEEVVQ